MRKMRTIEQAYLYLKEVDPDTSISKNALRQLVISGQVPSVKAGVKYLIDLGVLENYLAQGTSTMQTVGGSKSC